MEKRTLFLSYLHLLRQLQLPWLIRLADSLARFLNEDISTKNLKKNQFEATYKNRYSYRRLKDQRLSQDQLQESF